MPLRSCQEFLKARQPEALFFSLFSSNKMPFIGYSDIAPLLSSGMQTIHLMPNTVSETTGAVDVHPPIETIGRVAAGACHEAACRMRHKICLIQKAIGGFPLIGKILMQRYFQQSGFYMPDVDAASRLKLSLPRTDGETGLLRRYHRMPHSWYACRYRRSGFEKLNANLAKAICSIGAVKGFEIRMVFCCKSQGSVMMPYNRCSRSYHQGHQSRRRHSGRHERRFRNHFSGLPSNRRRPFHKHNIVTRKANRSIYRSKAAMIRSLFKTVVLVQSAAALVCHRCALMQNMTARVDYLRDFYKK